jgi:hypothetical protein
VNISVYNESGYYINSTSEFSDYLEETKTTATLDVSDKNLTDLVASLKSQVSLLNTKIKKICAARPKPKGC